MGCGGCSPDTPDYAGAAQQQGAANLAAAVATQNLSNPNTITPYGSQSWASGVDTKDKEGNTIPGRPTLTQTLAPNEQAKLDLSNKAQISSLEALNNAIPYINDTIIKPFGLDGSVQLDAGLEKSGPIQRQFDFSNIPGMPVADAGVRDQVSQSVFDQGARFLLPAFQQQQADLDAKLANQGITRGSEAQTREQGAIDTSRTQQLNDLASRAVQAGGDAMSQLYGLQMQGRQQGVNESTLQGNLWNTSQAQILNSLLADQTSYNNARGQAFQEYSTNRTMPLNMLNALLSSGQVNNPQFQPYTGTQVQATPIMQAAQLEGDAATAAFNAQMGLLGGAMKGATAFMSDRRLKSHIIPTDVFIGPFRLYDYEIQGRLERGVIADEVQKIMPDAVHRGDDGYLRVNYAMIGLPNGPEERFADR